MVRIQRFYCCGLDSVPGWGMRSCKMYDLAKKNISLVSPKSSGKSSFARP